MKKLGKMGLVLNLNSTTTNYQKKNLREPKGALRCSNTFIGSGGKTEPFQ